MYSCTSRILKNWFQYVIPSRHIIHSNLNINQDPNPVKLAYASYEDSLTRDLINENDAAPLIVMHGLFGSKGNWNSICKALQRKTKPIRKIVAVDARNHGDSPHDSLHTYEALAYDIKHLIETEKMGKKVALMGHSMGGRAMMLFALKWPEIVDKLIIADISPVSISPGYQKMLNFFRLMQGVQIPNNVSMSKARQIADTYLTRQISDKGVRQFLLTNLVQSADGTFKWRLNIPALYANYNFIGSFPQFDGQKFFNGPTLFISGSMSDYIQVDDQPKILKLFPKAEFISIDGAGHWLHSEKPNEFLQIILKKLNEE